MLTTRHAVDFAHTRQEFDTLFRYANAPDVEHGGRYDACSAAVNIRSDHWTHPATKEESETIGTFYFHWTPTAMLYEIDTDAGFSLEDSQQELCQLERQALGDVPHGDVPREDHPR
jgi:hypothetical protein